MPDYPPLILGIDPGQSGGIALIDARRGFETEDPAFVHAYPMPETEDDFVELLREYPTIQYAYVEQIQFGGNPADGAEIVDGKIKIKRGLTSSIKFGIGFGIIKGVLAALNIRREFVHPQRWQAAMGIPKREKKTKTEHKNVLKARAQQLFPGVKVTLAIADALLIAEYGRRQP